jgi:predicted RNA-binding protein with PUA domain
MMCGVGKILCKLGYHDFNKTADWFSKDCSVVVQEERCSRCEEEAYSLMIFEPERCKDLSRIAAGATEDALRKIFTNVEDANVELISCVCQENKTDTTEEVSKPARRKKATSKAVVEA